MTENMTAEREQELTIRPTVLLRYAFERVGEYMEERIYLVTAEPGSEEEALIVFRNPEDVEKFREGVGKYSAAEGFQLIGMGLEAIKAVLGKWGLRYVHMPEAWGEGWMVDTFKADSFVRILEESPRG